VAANGPTVPTGVLNGVASVSARLRAEVAAGRLQADSSQEIAALRLDELALKLKARPSVRMLLPWSRAKSTPVRGLYLCGAVGRGKTLLMDLFVDTLTAAAAPLPRPAERSHFYHFMRAVHAELATIRNHARPLEIVAERLAQRIGVLCLDEFFVTDIADAMLLAGLLDGLFRRGVTLVTTSNLKPEDLYKDGLQRQSFLPAIDSIRRHVDVICLDGGMDYRGRRLEQARTYFDSAMPDTEDSMQQRFAALAGGGQGPLLLAVEGRAIRAEREGGGAVWFEFAELCDGPRSQNDYIELARRYQALFVAHVPLFDAGNDNAARRFIMLIDELYDRGVKLVVSAAAPATNLYQGERLRFEFERAASRLIEMQTEQYLAAEHRP
jgi:cell division protein ZapE